MLAKATLRSVQRILEAHQLVPHRVRTFKLSNEAKFADKLKDIVGLYVDPPEHAVVRRHGYRMQHEAPSPSGVHPSPQHPRGPRWIFFTPTSASWLNAVEGFFAKLTRRRLQRGVFRSVENLNAAINRFVAETNSNPKPFVWTADPRRVLAAVKRGKQASESVR
jgi:hypothetical protein